MQELYKNISEVEKKELEEIVRLDKDRYFRERDEEKKLQLSQNSA